MTSVIKNGKNQTNVCDVMLFLTVSATPSSHHYDISPVGTSALPVYSTVKPRAKPISSSNSAAAIYDMATSNPRLGEGPPPLGNNTEYHLVSGNEAKKRGL